MRNSLCKTTFNLLKQLRNGFQTSNNLSKYAIQYDEAQPKYSEFNEQSPAWACNEWDPLEEVIVGRYENACVPLFTPELRAATPERTWNFFTENQGKYMKDVLERGVFDKLAAEVDEFIKVLEWEGVTVVRPEEFDCGKKYKTMDFESQGYDAAMIRDFVTVIGDEVIESTMTWRNRYFEYIPLRPLIKDYWRRGAKWTAAPKPIVNKVIDETFDRHKTEKYDENPRSVINEDEPVFDAADVIRCGRDVFIQISQVTNRAGAEWLRRHLAPRGVRVHELTFGNPNAMHIDVTFYPVLPGYILINPEFPCQQKHLFEKSDWKFIELTEFGFDDTGKQHFCHHDLAMNSLIVSPKKVIVEKNETALIKIYESLGMECIKVNYQNAFILGGSFHCWTADIRRKGKMESYF